jgi:hypothetical protein
MRVLGRDAQGSTANIPTDYTQNILTKFRAVRWLDPRERCTVGRRRLVKDEGRRS